MRKPSASNLSSISSEGVRQALHAAALGFRHPITDEPLSFEMPMPADMAKLLAKLRGKK